MIYHSTVLFVADIAIAKDFYCTVMKLEIEHDFGKNIIFLGGLSIWEIGDDHAIKTDLNTEKGKTRFELYFETENLSETERLLNERNVSFFHGIHEEPWGQRTLRFFDPDGNLVEVGEPLHVFVSNLSARGLAYTAIHEKTGVSMETIRQILQKN